MSEYQGTVDWFSFKHQGIQFAFIKASEGSSYVDPYYVANAIGAEEANIPFGAYHFFSFDSNGDTQAELFIRTIGYQEGMMLPVIDIELYGAHKTTPPTADSVIDDISTFIRIIYDCYGRYPMIYTTQQSFDLYIAHRFPECPIWIRDVYFIPKLSDGREWSFWQYSDRGKLDGYEGEEEYIDLNVFYGQADELDLYRIFDRR